MPQEICRTARMLRTISIIAMILGFVGIIGAGYVDEMLRVSPSRPDASHGYVIPLDYKGQVRFVSPMNAQINTIAVPLAFGGAGAGVFVGLISLFISRTRS